MSETEIADVRLFTRRLFDSAKNRWLLSVAVRTLAFLIGVLVLLFSAYAHKAAWFVAVAAITAEVAAFQADKRKALAEWLLRQLDMNEGFGRPIPFDEVADLRITLPAIAPSFANSTEACEPYFAAASDTLASDRAVRNTQESAWWSKHLAAVMFRWYSFAFVLLLGVGFISVLVAVETAKQVAALDTVARVAITVVVFAFSATIGRQALGYKAFQEGAEASEKKAGRLLEQRDSAVIDAMALMAEYHIRRAGSPLIPSFVHERNRARLTAEWQRRTTH